MFELAVCHEDFVCDVQRLADLIQEAYNALEFADERPYGQVEPFLVRHDWI